MRGDAAAEAQTAHSICRLVQVLGPSMFLNLLLFYGLKSKELSLINTIDWLDSNAG